MNTLIYRPTVNKKELIGFLAHNDIDEYRVCPFCDKPIDYLALRRNGAIPANLFAWCMPFGTDSFSLQLAYKCYCSVIFSFIGGKLDKNPVTYGCTQDKKPQTVEFNGFHPVKSVVKR